ncbi:MAG TPA: 30S ribosomal protein S6 [Verrucomicrobiae bacterium]|nr:30S ribosomal protein S6 [Verrucomicrobiae bacterium]
MKKYEGLFILNTAGKEENVKELIDKVTEEISHSGGKVETVQKMDKRQFSRVANKKFSSGFYVNVIFESEPQNVAHLRSRFALNEDVFRVLFTEAPEPKKQAAAA